MTPVDPTRAAIEAAFGPLQDEQWCWIVEKGYAEDWRSDPAATLRELRSMRQTWGQEPPPRSADGRWSPRADTVQPAVLAREWALGQWVRQYVLDDEVGTRGQTFPSEAQEWRAANLPAGRPLTPTEVGPWMRRQLRRRPKGWRAPMPAAWDGSWSPTTPEGGVDVVWMEVVGDQWAARRWPTPASSPLGCLALLVDRLADRYRVLPEVMARLILCDIDVTVPTVTARAELNRSTMSSAFDRVVLTVDPMATAEQVASAWTTVRSNLLASVDAEGRKRRPRLPDEKAATLAGFVASMPPGETWEAARARWNRRVGDRGGWGYDSRQTFTNAAHAATRLLLRTGQRWRERHAD